MGGMMAEPVRAAVAELTDLLAALADSGAGGTVIGEVGIRARHAPMLARLVPHEMRLFESESDFGSSDGARRYAAAEGWLAVGEFAILTLSMIRVAALYRFQGEHGPSSRRRSVRVDDRVNCSATESRTCRLPSPPSRTG